MNRHRIWNFIVGMVLIYSSITAERDALRFKASTTRILGMDARTVSLMSFFLMVVCGVLGIYSFAIAFGIINRDR
jgi:hypothetical protein